MGRTLGVHWIATTHGTWLHGDVRGSWRDGRLIGADPFAESAIRGRMTHDAVVLDVVEMMTVATSFGQTMREGGHRVYAATVQATHVHVVFGPLDTDVSALIAKLKYRAACEILQARRNMRRDDVPRSLWTKGQFPVFIFETDHLHNAVEYVRRHNTQAGRAAEPYDWIEVL
ncbi:hypothetical protein HED60_16340 [Planctomycetales bacterium ZRK34]|nr:hypothetical protein HED60_16340 [Planctomycetales bacterium ZRK34]